MQKRSEANKEVKMLFKTKLKRTVMVLLCLVFAYSAIYAADVSNKTMLNKQNEDKYALRLGVEKKDMLRIDLAGTKYYYNISNIKLYMNDFADKAKGFVVRMQKEYEKLQEKL